MKSSLHDELQDEIAQYEYAIDMFRFALRHAKTEDDREEIESQIDEAQGKLQVLLNLQDDRI